MHFHYLSIFGGRFLCTAPGKSETNVSEGAVHTSFTQHYQRARFTRVQIKIVRGHGSYESKLILSEGAVHTSSTERFLHPTRTIARVPALITWRDSIKVNLNQGTIDFQGSKWLQPVTVRCPRSKPVRWYVRFSPVQNLGTSVKPTIKQRLRPA